MKTIKIVIILSVLILVLSCGKKEAEAFSEEKPYTVEVKRERSYFQAKKISDRLKSIELESFIASIQDAIEGQWFGVYSGVFKEESLAKEYIEHLTKTHSFDDLKVVDFNEVKEKSQNVEVIRDAKRSIVEKQRIAANTPDIPSQILEVVDKYPDNNAFYLNTIALINLDHSRAISHVGEQIKLDMPRGITLTKAARYCTAISEVQYIDNLYSDGVTISIMRLKDNIDVDVAKIFCEDIINTRRHISERMAPIRVNAFNTLSGYKVTLQTTATTERTYFVLVDALKQYVIISQSTKKTDNEMIAILSEVGKSDGLNNYDEFYNTFYILPDRNVDTDAFLGYNIAKLTRSYAQSKGNAQWAREMVGHWNVDAYFHNSSKGFWTFGLFDLLTPSAQNRIYGTMYASEQTANTKRIVCGVEGHLVSEDNPWYFMRELNFGVDRYVFAIHSNDRRMQESDMVTRAEAMQFQKNVN